MKEQTEQKKKESQRGKERAINEALTARGGAEKSGICKAGTVWADGQGTKRTNAKNFVRRDLRCNYCSDSVRQ